MKLKLPPNRIPFLRRFSKDKSGVVAVEMTLVFIPFILLFLFIAELCSVLYVSVSIDLAMAEAMRFTSSSSSADMTEYKRTFLQKMQDRVTELPLMIYKAENVNFDVKYCESLEKIANGTCNSSSPSQPSLDADGEPIYGTGTPLAFYSVQYTYTPLFLPIPNSVVNPAMARNGIYIMETTRYRKVPRPGASGG